MSATITKLSITYLTTTNPILNGVKEVECERIMSLVKAKPVILNKFAQQIDAPVRITSVDCNVPVSKRPAKLTEWLLSFKNRLVMPVTASVQSSVQEP